MLRKVYNPAPLQAAMNAPHWHVLGAGAMGCLFATELLDAGARVTLLLRDARQRAQWDSAGGLLLSDMSGSCRRYQPLVSRNDDGEPIRYLLVTTKAHDAAAAVAAVAHRLAPQSLVLLLLNGMGVREELATLLPGLTIACGTTTEAALRQGPFTVRHTGCGHTRLGQTGAPQPAEWFSVWRDCALQATWEPEIDAALWQKLAINCAINPLTALHGCANGQLLEPPLAPALDGLCQEISAIVAAAGHTELAATLDRQVAGVLRATAGNRSSMLQDLSAGRSTEIDYITGYLVALAGRLGVAAPINQSLLRQVRQINREHRDDRQL